MPCFQQAWKKMITRKERRKVRIKAEEIRATTKKSQTCFFLRDNDQR